MIWMICVSINGICCDRSSGLRGLSPLLQPFGLHLFYILYFIAVQLTLIDIKVYTAEKEYLAKS